MNIRVLLPARLGSSRVTQKVLLPFGTAGDTLLSWKIKQLCSVVAPEDIIVSSESDEILEVARSLGTSIHERDPYLSDGHKASFSEVVSGIISEIEAEHVAWCPCVTPLMQSEEYVSSFEAYEKAINSGEYDSLVGVCDARDYYWDSEKPINYVADRNHIISQHLPQWYRVTNSLYMAPRDVMLKAGYVLGEKPALHILPKHAGIDIDDWFDYQVALAMYSAQLEENIQKD